MQPTQDEPLCHAIARAVETQTGTRPEVMTGVQHPSEMMGLFHRFQTVVAVRLHAAIFAAKAGVPVITIPYDPKVEALSRNLGIIQAPLNELVNRWNLFRTQQNDSLERLRQRTSEMQNSAQACLERIKTWLS
jgi:polysaccharide pyruvyl transferase WcaK-like protein